MSTGVMQILIELTDVRLKTDYSLSHNITKA